MWRRHHAPGSRGTMFGSGFGSAFVDAMGGEIGSTVGQAVSRPLGKTLGVPTPGEELRELYPGVNPWELAGSSAGGPVVAAQAQRRQSSLAYGAQRAAQRTQRQNVKDQTDATRYAADRNLDAARENASAIRDAATTSAAPGHRTVDLKERLAPHQIRQMLAAAGFDDARAQEIRTLLDTKLENLKADTDLLEIRAHLEPGSTFSKLFYTFVSGDWEFTGSGVISALIAVGGIVAFRNPASIQAAAAAAARVVNLAGRQIKRWSRRATGRAAKGRMKSNLQNVRGQVTAEQIKEAYRAAQREGFRQGKTNQQPIWK